jgi:pilus assembly protein FimV
MKGQASLATIAALMFAASAALAQGTGAAGGNPGTGGAAGAATTPGANASPGTGTASGATSVPGSSGRAGGARAPNQRYDDSNTPGWSTMSATERSDHQRRMQSFRTYEECRAYMGEHSTRMRARPNTPGSTAGIGVPGAGQTDATGRGNDVCAHLPRG